MALWFFATGRLQTPHGYATTMEKLGVGGLGGVKQRNKQVESRKISSDRRRENELGFFQDAVEATK